MSDLDKSSYQKIPLLQHEAHVNQEGHKKDWETGFWSCCSPWRTCCLGTFCPCILYARTQYRLEHSGSIKGYSFFNSNCLFYYCLSSMASPLQTFLGYAQRKKIREQYGLSGSSCGDCLRHLCCPCCSLIQEGKEVIERSKNPSGYQPSEGMNYPNKF